MHVTARGFGPNNLFAVKVSNDPQGSVSSGVLRSDVESHALSFKFNIQPRVSRLRGDISQLFAINEGFS